jgi:hypothetical protein
MVQKQLAGRGKNGDRPRLSRVGYCSFNLFVVCPRFRPVVVRLFDKSGGSDFSHFVVVDGVTTKNGIPVVAIRDPHGTQYFSPVTTFERNFSGEVVVPRSALE